MPYPTELVARAKYEIRVFERVAMDTGIELLAEVERLRELLRTSDGEYTHRCIRCFNAYTPPPGANEDCPSCGCDGTMPKKSVKRNAGRNCKNKEPVAK